MPFDHEVDVWSVANVNLLFFQHVLQNGQPIPDLVDGGVEAGQEVGSDDLSGWVVVVRRPRIMILLYHGRGSHLNLRA